MTCICKDGCPLCLSPEDSKAHMENLKEKVKKEAEEFNSDLRKRAKPTEDLKVFVECDVKMVYMYFRRMSHTPRSEVRIGGTSPSYNTGLMATTRLEVNTKEGVKIIKMTGTPHLSRGDKIRAYVFKGQEVSEKSTELFGAYRRRLNSHFIERDWEEEEIAFKIKKIDEKGNVLAIYEGA